MRGCHDAQCIVNDSLVGPPLSLENPPFVASKSEEQRRLWFYSVKQQEFPIQVFIHVRHLNTYLSSLRHKLG